MKTMCQWSSCAAAQSGWLEDQQDLDPRTQYREGRPDKHCLVSREIVRDTACRAAGVLGSTSQDQNLVVLIVEAHLVDL